MAVFRKGAELLDQPGRALTTTGQWQAYYLDKSRLIEMAGQGHDSAAEPMSQQAALRPTPAIPVELDAPDRLLAEQCLDENNGRFTEEWLRSAGYSQRHARAIKARWWSNGWLVVDETVLGKPAVLAVQVREQVNSSAADLSCTEAHDKARQAHD